jgi:hypothetical protein
MGVHGNRSRSGCWQECGVHGVSCCRPTERGSLRLKARYRPRSRGRTRGCTMVSHLDAVGLSAPAGSNGLKAPRRKNSSGPVRGSSGFSRTDGSTVTGSSEPCGSQPVRRQHEAPRTPSATSSFRCGQIRSLRMWHRVHADARPDRLPPALEHQPLLAPSHATNQVTSKRVTTYLSHNKQTWQPKASEPRGAASWRRAMGSSAQFQTHRRVSAPPDERSAERMRAWRGEALRRSRG